MRFSLCVLLLLSLSACQSGTSSTDDAPQGSAVPASEAQASEPEAAAETQPAATGQPEAMAVPEGMSVATFAGGCFWCMEPPFEKLEGVLDAISGYTAGPEKAPTYKQVSSGSTGHTEAVRVIYDPAKVDYKTLVETFWRGMDPTDAGGQFADRGSQYRPAIFVHTPEQREIAEASKQALMESKRFDKPIVVPIEPAQAFWVAEEYHQNYYKTNAAHYNAYKKGSGRAGFLEKTWGN